MYKVFFSIIVAMAIAFSSNAQSPLKVVYAELFGPGVIPTANFDIRFSSNNNGFGARVGVGGLVIGGTGLISIPIGVNYIISKDQKNYFEAGAGYTYLSSGVNYMDKWEGSVGNLTFGYRYAPIGGGFFFKAQITPLFGDGMFLPFFGGIGLGYKIN